MLAENILSTIGCEALGRDEQVVVLQSLRFSYCGQTILSCGCGFENNCVASRNSRASGKSGEEQTIGANLDGLGRNLFGRSNIYWRHKGRIAIRGD